jgi:glycogen debranching enzyme
MSIHVEVLTRTLCDLGGVDRLEKLGQRGPLLASAGASSLFHCLFGRDSIRMAQDLLEDFPAVARVTLLELARLQGVVDNPRGEEEPGRILHEYRDPENPHTARLVEVWDMPYFGAVDSTPQWVNLLCSLCARQASTDMLRERVTDRLGHTVTLLQSLLRAVAWILRRLDDPRGGGYLWVRRASPRGIVNQVWEDSCDSYYHADGRLFDPDRPYAPVHVQGYAYDALLGAAELLQHAGAESSTSIAAHLRALAARLRSQVLEAFWQADLGTFAQALTIESDATAPRAARVVSSAPGHLLASRLLDGADAAGFREQLAWRLLQSDLLCSAGVRTKSTTAARFRAGSYHNGSTWPMDTGIIADGLRRHGYTSQADDLEQRMLLGCSQVGGFPEFFRGNEDEHVAVNVATVDAVVDGVSNRLEQPPQANQGWTATRVWRILRARGAITPARMRRVR